jgi:hypothetical protein
VALWGVGLLRVRGGRWRYADDDRPGALPGLATVRPLGLLTAYRWRRVRPRPTLHMSAKARPHACAHRRSRYCARVAPPPPWDGRGTAATAAAACGMPATSAPGLCLTPTTCTGTGPRPAAMRCETLLVGATQLALAVVAQPAHREQRREAPRRPACGDRPRVQVWFGLGCKPQPRPHATHI